MPCPTFVALTCYTATLAITFGVNIPFINGLSRAAAAGDTSAGGKSFERRWTLWNIHRTWLSFAALVSVSIARASL
ncbi:anthrone oxygenase family protein [Pseudarthrobacter sulfonivorans]|uniref:anthrone oxygenase family protein n=1 Tax=Pseudarthrobacter sulfonivorans TaxID=121292 RepID=UPI0035A839BB